MALGTFTIKTEFRPSLLGKPILLKGNYAMTCRKARDFVATKPLGVSPGGAGPGADLGGSSNYSGEGLVQLSLKFWRRGLKVWVKSFVGLALFQGFYLARGKSGVVLQRLRGFS